MTEVSEDRLKRIDQRFDHIFEIKKLTEPTFQNLGESRYRFLLPEISTTLEADYLRREGGELKCELLVRCEILGAKTVDGVLSVSNLNLSSARTRSSHAKHLAERARTKEIDWDSILEEFAMRVLAAEREGSPAALLDTFKPPGKEKLVYVGGLPLLAAHPLILFGDGGTAKSYLSLWMAGMLAKDGWRVGYFDWELTGEEHRGRLDELFPGDLPPIYYARCARPFHYEGDRLRRVVRENYLEYCIFDSVAFACDGRPEEAEVTLRYFQALRSLGLVGSLHIAHISKQTEFAHLSPFGSSFWKNGARSTWNIQLADTTPGDSTTQVALYHRKWNTTGRHPTIGFNIHFSEGRTTVKPCGPEEFTDLAAGMSIAERLRVVLKRGPLARGQVAEQLEDINADSLRKTLAREIRAGRVLVMPGAVERLALKGREP